MKDLRKSKADVAIEVSKPLAMRMMLVGTRTVIEEVSEGEIFDEATVRVTGVREDVVERVRIESRENLKGAELEFNRYARELVRCSVRAFWEFWVCLRRTGNNEYRVWIYYAPQGEGVGTEGVFVHPRAKAFLRGRD